MTLRNTGAESGCERWEEPDRSAVEYRAGDAVLRFEAFTGGTLGLRRRIGARITAHHGRFELAEIDSHYFVRASGLVFDVVLESSSARNAAHLDQHESRKHGGAVETDLPDRVDALCRAQWRGARYRYVVTTGQLDRGASADTPRFPDGFPEDWPLPDRVEVAPDRLLIAAVGADHRGKASITVRNRAAVPQTITVRPPSHYSFEVVSGEIVIPGGRSVRVPVRFLPPQDQNRVFGSLVIDTPSGAQEVQLEGQLNGKSNYAPN